jgi:hypothetical protein
LSKYEFNKHDGMDSNRFPFNIYDNDHLTNYGHLVMFHENKEYAKEIHCKFIKEGLLRGEYCVILSNSSNWEYMKGEIALENQHLKNKIDELVKIIYVPGTMCFSGMEKLSPVIDDLSTSYRILVESVGEIRSRSDISRIEEIENNLHSVINKSGLPLICSYDINYTSFKIYGELLARILQIHDSVIFAPLDEKEIIMPMN